MLREVVRLEEVQAHSGNLRVRRSQSADARANKAILRGRALVALGAQGERRRGALQGWQGSHWGYGLLLPIAQQTFPNCQGCSDVLRQRTNNRQVS